MTKCIECQNLDMQARPEMTKLGFPRCKKLPTYEYVSIKRDLDCEKFTPANIEVIEKRVVWCSQRDLSKNNVKGTKCQEKAN